MAPHAKRSIVIESATTTTFDDRNNVVGVPEPLSPRRNPHLPEEPNPVTAADPAKRSPQDAFQFRQVRAAAPADFLVSRNQQSPNSGSVALPNQEIVNASIRAPASPTGWSRIAAIAAGSAIGFRIKWRFDLVVASSIHSSA
jgi:hypothetical protein